MKNVGEAVGIRKLLRVLVTPDIAGPQANDATLAEREPAHCQKNDCGDDDDGNASHHMTRSHSSSNTIEMFTTLLRVLVTMQARSAIVTSFRSKSGSLCLAPTFSVIAVNR